jgi:hypothetical protein
MRFFLGLCILLCTESLFAQNIYIDETGAMDESSTRSRVAMLIKAGQLNGTWIMCDKRYVWSAPGKNDTLSSIKVVGQELTENDLTVYAMQQMKKGRMKGNVTACGYNVKWKAKDKQGKKFDLVTRRVRKKKIKSSSSTSTYHLRRRIRSNLFFISILS